MKTPLLGDHHKSVRQGLPGAAHPSKLGVNEMQESYMSNRASGPSRLRVKGMLKCKKGLYSLFTCPVISQCISKSFVSAEIGGASLTGQRPRPPKPRTGHPQSRSSEAPGH